jgi:hypothetical protein
MKLSAALFARCRLPPCPDDEAQLATPQVLNNFCCGRCVALLRISELVCSMFFLCAHAVSSELNVFEHVSIPYQGEHLQ